jgi:hypothetical protein
MRVPMQGEAVVEDCRFVPREIAFLKFLGYSIYTLSVKLY